MTKITLNCSCGHSVDEHGQWFCYHDECRCTKSNQDLGTTLRKKMKTKWYFTALTRMCGAGKKQ